MNQKWTLRPTLSFFPGQQKENSLSSLEAKIVKSLQDDYKEDSHIMKIWNETMNQVRLVFMQFSWVPSNK